MADLAEIGVFGGSGFYSLLDDVREIKVDTPYGPPSDCLFLADGRRTAGRVPAAPRPSPHDPAAQDQLPGERLGDALARRQGGHLPCAAGSLQPHVEPGHFVVCDQFVDRTQRPRRHLLRRTDRQPRQLGRDLRPDAPPARHRGHPGARHHRPRAGHGGRHPGAALLDQGRVEVVQRSRLGGHQHDPVSRGLPVPRARHGGRQHQPHHRLRRRCHRGHRGGQRARASWRSSRRTRPASRRSSWTWSAGSRPTSTRSARARRCASTRGDGHAMSPEDIRIFETGL